MSNTEVCTKFAPGHRVVALADTEWDDELDDFTESELAYMRLHGHHGRVVANCDLSECDHDLHVVWEGVHDGRSAGRTYWMHGVWHMYDDEIEHAD